MGMTGKRFLVKYLEYDAYYVDTEKEYVDNDYYLELDGYQTMSDEQVVECLNKFFEENEQLKQQIKGLDDTIDGLTETIFHYNIERDLE